MPCLENKISKVSRQKLVLWIIKNSNVCEYPIARDTSFITDAESGVKQRVPKLLLEWSMRHLYNGITDLPDDGGLLGARRVDKNYVIISETMLRSLTPPKLRPITDHQKMMCGCAICNTSKYFQESLNAWWRKQLTIMRYETDNSCGSYEDELTQS